MQQALKTKLDLNFHIYKSATGKNGETQWILCLKKKDVPLLVEKIKPFVVPSMFYKLGLNCASKPALMNLKKAPAITVLKKNRLKRLRANSDCDGMEMKLFLELTEPLIKLKAFVKWFERCGSFIQRDQAVRLSTQEAEKDLLAKAQLVLQKDLNLFFKLQKHHVNKAGKTNYILYLPKNQVPLLVTLIKPFLNPIFYYKLGL